jgi:type IV fimbrial biogenesis protein FimT
MQSSKPSPTAGFTLFGLLVSILIAAILLAMSVNTVGGAAAKVNSSVASARLATSIQRSRSLAIMGDSDVVLCPSGDGLHCAKSTHWESGWIAFADRRDNGERDDDEPVVLREDALGNRVHLVSTQGRTRLRFQAVFGGNGGSNVTFTLCDARGPHAATAWVLSNNGRLHTADPTPANVAAACAN